MRESPARATSLMPRSRLFCSLPKQSVLSLSWAGGGGRGGHLQEALAEGPCPSPVRDCGDPAAFCGQMHPRRCPSPAPRSCPGFDLPTQPGGVPPAGVPGGTGPQTCQGRVTPAGEKDTPQTRAQALLQEKFHGPTSPGIPTPPPPPSGGLEPTPAPSLCGWGLI